MFNFSFKHSPAITRWLALIWLLVMLALAWHQWQFWREPALATDVFAALPKDKQSAFADRALQQLAQDNERRIVVLIGSPDWPQAQQAADAFQTAMAHGQSPFQPVENQVSFDDLLHFYEPWRDALLTAPQRDMLATTEAPALAERGLQRLYGLGQMQPSSWLKDPLGLWPAWWAERLQQSPVRQSEGLLRVQDPHSGMQYALLIYETREGAFRFDGERTWSLALEAAKEATLTQLRTQPQAGKPEQLQWHMAGIPLFAEEGAAQGHNEMNTIGWGSLIAVVLLALLAFMAIRPMLLVALSLMIGCAAGLSATAWVFGEVHVLTLVFGASLVGVAEDFGIHYFASRMGSQAENTAATRWQLMRHLMPGLFIALVTSVIAYAVLAIVPFPGLRQMALFSAVGLAAAFATVICWFPLLDQSKIKEGAVARAMANSIGYWPVVRRRQLPLFLLVILVFSAGGIARMDINDNLRALQPAAPALMQDQQAVQQILQMPSMVQFFLVRGDSPQQVLEREEALSAYVDGRNRSAAADTSEAEAAAPLRLQALSQWIPSLARQQENRALSAHAEAQALATIGAQLEEDLQRPAAAKGGVSLEQWLASPASNLMRAQWLKQLNDGQFASVVLVQTSGRAIAEADLSAIAQAQAQGQLAGVQWQDRIHDLSNLLSHFRVEMGWLLVLGHAIVLLALMWRFGKQAWRAWLPCALASLLTIAILGYAGQSFQLFNVLALLLLLGMGVDYGIFLLEHQGHEEGHAWLAILVGGSSTILSFGLLGLSSTPALRAFGLTLLIGLPLVVLLAPMLRSAPAKAQQAPDHPPQT